MSAGDVQLRLTGDELAFLAHHLGISGSAPAAGAEAALQARRLVARGPDGGVQIDSVAVALVGTWLRPVAGVRVASSAAGVVQTADFFHLAAVTVEHHTAGEGEEHVFQALTSLAALAGRLGALAGLPPEAEPPGHRGGDGRSRPPGERLWLPLATAEAIWAAAGTGGAAGVRQVLTRADAGVPGDTARSLGQAMERAQRLVRLEAFAVRPAAPAGASLGGLRLVQGPDGYWAFSSGPRDDAVDVRPVSTAQVGGLLTVMAAAVVRPRPAGPAAW
jgi:hypothetical protein